MNVVYSILPSLLEAESNRNDFQIEVDVALNHAAGELTQMQASYVWSAFMCYERHHQKWNLTVELIL